MVSVSLLRLVCVAGTRDLWPSEFSDLVAKCEENPADRTPFGVTADWCDESGETQLGEAFRWMFKRIDVELRKGDDAYYLDQWTFRRLPNSLAGDVPNPHFIDRTHIAGLMADLAYRMQKLREDLA